MIMQILDSNFTLNDIVLGCDNLSAPFGIFKNLAAIAPAKLTALWGPDMKSKLLAVSSHNKDIFQLRDYLTHFLQEMEKPPRISFD